MNNSNIVDVLIKDIKTDQGLLTEVEKQINESKDTKRNIIDRLKDYQKDLSVMLKYANEEQQSKIKELGFDLSESSKGLNSVASIAFDLIMKAKDNKLTNIALYNQYVKSLGKNDEAVNYTEFNIKCRPLFNSQKLLRTKGNDPKSSREDIISLNGRVMTEKDISSVQDSKKDVK